MKILLALLGGASALFLAMGVARFAFTPILPLMQGDFHFSDTVSGALASVNYLGYLLGAFYARYLSVTKRAYPFFIASIPLSLLLVGVMYIHSYPLWYTVRFISGFLSAVVFVMSAEFIMDYLARLQRPQLGGMIYSGIGGGMVLSGLTVPILSKYFNSSEIWLWLAGLSLLPAFFAVFLTPKPHTAGRDVPKTSKNVNRLIYLLSAAYLLEGAGYIITGTFMSVIVLRGTGSVMLSGYVWVIAGLGAVLITPLWAMLAKRTGVANAMIYAFAMQAVSIALPVVFSGLTPTMLGAVGFGGTFLGIVSLTLAYGRQISPGGTTTSVLTVFFSIGQMIGPLIAGYIAYSTGGFDLPVLMAASAAALGGLITFIIKKGEHHAVT
ncbi:MAG: YbfB/YjiJ family MFS transporter [Deferribacterales bacterium]